MKLLKQSCGVWEYELNPVEGDLLHGLLNGYPFTDPRPARISQGDHVSESDERTEMLNEALAEHRKELKNSAGEILGLVSRKKTCWRLKVDDEHREILLQILNDIRIGCWHALGAPESLRTATSADPREFAFRNWMDLAGYFEQSLIEAE